MSDVWLPGTPPPWFIPFCASCDMPVAKFTAYPIETEDCVSVEAECHGKTTGTRVTRVQLEMLRANNAKLVMFRRERGFDSVR